MHGDNIKEIKEKAEKVYKLLDFIFYGTIIFFVILSFYNSSTFKWRHDQC